MLEDPDYLLGIFAMSLVGSGLGYLLFIEWRRSWRERNISVTTALSGLSILCLFWFFAWMLTQGAIPRGLWGLAAAGVFLVPVITIRPRKK